jgi:hypothetical protein|tara:strand:- start:9 stop:332 length:324 start_codon:yes stop_codon:yes gene_type:complete
MKERKDLQRMSAAMMRIKSPLKLQTDKPKDKKVVASTTDVSLQNDPGKDPAKSKMYQKIVQDDADIAETERLTKIVQQTYGKGTGKKFRASDPREQLRLVLTKRAGE